MKARISIRYHAILLLLIWFSGIKPVFGEKLPHQIGDNFLTWANPSSLMLWRPRKIPVIEEISLSSPDEKAGINTSSLFIVAVDPGHGGEDKGARGFNKHKEKDIVFEIAKKTIALLKQNKDVYPILIRKGDYFLSLKHRCKIAHYNKADIMISIHTNAHTSKKVQGTSIYFLSRDGASNRASALIAARENASDLVEGFSYSDDPLLDTVLVDLMQEYSLNESKRLGKIVLDSMVKQTGRRNLGLLGADFGILKVPDIPSVLVETAFITNKEEEELLTSNSFQNKIAEAISEAVFQYTQK